MASAAGTPACARTYYVSPSGSDEASGSAGHPWRTLQRAASVAVAGDTVIIAGGVYPVSTPIRPAHSGRADAPIVFHADVDHPAIIDASDDRGAGMTAGAFAEYGVFPIEGVSYLRIENLQLRDAHSVGFMIRGEQTQHIDLIGCKTSHSYGSGVGIWYARFVRVIGCEIVGANEQEMRRADQPLAREAPHEALSVAGAQHFEIAYNHVHHGAKEGIDVKEVSAHGIVHDNEVYDMPRQGLYTDAWFGRLEDVEFRDNFVHGCEWGMAISVEGERASMRDVRVHHNIFYGNRGSGILFGVWGSDGPRTDILVYNNTIYRNGSAGHWAGAVGGIDVRSKNLARVAIFNNIAFGNEAFDIATFDASPTGQQLARQAIQITTNLVGKAVGAGSATALRGGEFPPLFATSGQNAVVGDPLFANPTADDFRLRSGSLAKGVGLKGRAADSSIDLGAIGSDRLR